MRFKYNIKAVEKISIKQLIKNIKKKLEIGVLKDKENEYILEIMHKIISQALKDLQDNQPFLIADAVYYFFRQDNKKYHFHFVNICESMKEDAQKLRFILKQICNMMANEKPMPLKLINILQGGIINE